jgi:hypothetical protein
MQHDTTISENKEWSWDRCYDFKNIFAEIFSEKIGVFDSKQANFEKM